MNRKEAKELDLKQYDGKACDKCENTKRYVSNYNCVSCQNNKTNKYAKTDTAKNRHKIYISGRLDERKAAQKKYQATYKGQAHTKDYYKNNKDKYRDSTLKRTYGISLAEYNDMLKAQDNTCAICDGTSKKNLHVDHDHATGEVRGLLCHGCNTALGLLNESKDTMRKMVNYICQRSP
tara:strand:- start:5908 stop:6441 length:534 start_codon:yes stop_codon:yes gene_type:complete